MAPETARAQDAASSASPPLDEVVFESPSVMVGAFRCPLSHPSFRDSGPIQNHIFVFPRHSVGLCHEGGQPFLADPSIVTLYNRGQRYTRSAMSAWGDRCEWFAVRGTLLLDFVRRHDPGIEDRPERPFRHAYGPCHPRTYLAQRALFERMRTASAIEPLEVEETVVDLLGQVLLASYAFWGAPLSARAPTPGQLDAARRAGRLLEERLDESLHLEQIARAVGLSSFHLCRTFRAATGSTLHAYRNRARLHESLSRLADGEDLTEIGLSLGFSSHSHFTSAFRRLFGLTPSEARRRLRGSFPGGRHMGCSGGCCRE